MKTTTKKLLLLSVVLPIGIFISGCAIHKLNDNGSNAYMIKYDSNSRGQFFFPDDKKMKLISEPSPDTVLQSTYAFTGKMNYQSVTGEVSANLTSQALQLGQRTEMIMFLRETMFRLSEAGNNAGWSPKDYKDLYNKIIKAAVILAQTEQTEAESNKTNAVTKAQAQQNVSKTLLLYEAHKDPNLLKALEHIKQ
jgi:hypothetical protein